MTAYARHPSEQYEQPTDYAPDYDARQWEIDPGERLGPPVGRRRGKRVFRAIAIVLITAGVGWVYLYGGSIFSIGWQWASAAVDSVSGVMDRRPLPTQAVTPPVDPLPAGPETATMPTFADAQPALPEPIATIESTGQGTDATSLALAVPPAGTQPSGPATRAPAKPNPYQKHAASIGLNPDLPGELLERLSNVDYQNAAVAIQKALAEKTETAVVTWPREQKVGQATFQVYFVPAAGSGCRRYVVTVAKGGWSTTAPPMEKCGAEAATPRG